MSAKWRLTVHPILGYQGEKGGGGGANVLPLFLEGANIHHYAFVERAIILPCQLLGGQMSTHAIFHRGVNVREGGGGGNVRLPVFFIAIKILIEPPVSKQQRPQTDAEVCGEFGV